MHYVVPTRASLSAASVGFKIMYEDGHTVCDSCDKDTGEFHKHNGNDLCDYCWRDLN